VIKVNTTAKKVACFLPGLGTPVSLYFTVTSKKLRSTGLKGLAILPIAAVLPSSSLVPTSIALIAGTYIYWGIIAMAGSWGFLGMLFAYRAIAHKAGSTEQVVPISQQASELIPTASTSEVLPDMDAKSILNGIERLPVEEREELVAKILNK
jgi:hypothetical protein